MLPRRDTSKGAYLSAIFLHHCLLQEFILLSTRNEKHGSLLKPFFTLPKIAFPCPPVVNVTFRWLSMSRGRKPGNQLYPRNLWPLTLRQKDNYIMLWRCFIFLLSTRVSQYLSFTNCLPHKGGRAWHTACWSLPFQCNLAISFSIFATALFSFFIYDTRTQPFIWEYFVNSAHHQDHKKAHTKPTSA